MNALIVTIEPPGSGAVAREADCLASALCALGHRVATLVPRAAPAGGGEFPAEAEGAVRFKWEGEEFALSKTGRRAAADQIHLWHREFAAPPAFYSLDGPDRRGAARRCALFCRGAVEAARRLRPSPQVLLPLDWPTALAAPIIKQERLPLACAIPVLDPRHHGVADPSLFELLHLAPAWFAPETGEFFGQFSFLKAGLAACDRILVRGGRALYDLQHNPAEPLAGSFRSLAFKVRLFASPPPQQSAAALSTKIRSAGHSLPAEWRKGGSREKCPVLALCALDSACLHPAISAARLLAISGWNVLLHAPEALRRDAEFIEVDLPENGVASTLPELSDEEIFALADVAFFCSDQFRDAPALAACAMLGAWPVPIRRPHLAEALDLALAPEALADSDPPRFTFDLATEEALIDAGRALLPHFSAGPGKRARSVAAAAARSAQLRISNGGDPLAFLAPNLASSARRGL